MTMNTLPELTTPIVPGFFPDPSMCVVGDAVYLAASSFEYHPGIPIHRSTDLVHWEQIGNVVDRASQRPYSVGTASRGLFAPTLRHHDGRFWLIVGDVDFEEDGQRLYHAVDPAGPWSDPILIPEAQGIDPDIAWDDDGNAFITWAGPTGTPLWNSQIMQAHLDIETGRLLAKPTLLWSGTGMKVPEAPHVFRRDDWWYLLIAEGGTERGHSVSIARSRSPYGPFTGFEGNPILSHRSTNLPVQNTGHADIAQLPDGSWAMTFLAVRPTGTTPGFHVNGRESFLASVSWVDDWPVIEPWSGEAPASDHSFVDEFAADDLHPRWISPGAPPSEFTRLLTGGGLAAAAAEPESTRPHIVAARARDPFWRATVDIDVNSGSARFIVRLDDAHWYGVTLDRADVFAESSVGPFRTCSEPATIGAGIARLWIEVEPPTADADAPGRADGPDQVRLGFDGAGGPVTLATWDGRYLSSEVVGGFTGRVIGLEPLEGETRIVRFAYADMN